MHGELCNRRPALLLITFTSQYVSLFWEVLWFPTAPPTWIALNQFLDILDDKLFLERLCDACLAQICHVASLNERVAHTKHISPSLKRFCDFFSGFPRMACIAWLNLSVGSLCWTSIQLGFHQWGILFAYYQLRIYPIEDANVKWNLKELKNTSHRIHTSKEQSDAKIMFDDELGSVVLFGQSGHLRDRTPLLTSPLCFKCVSWCK